MRNAPSKPVSVESKARDALRIAREIVQSSESWQGAINSLYSPGGKLSELFPTREAREEFSDRPEAKQIDKLLADLRTRTGSEPPADVNGKILVRIPKSMHAALIQEANAEGVSLNQLCVAKLAVALGQAVSGK